MDNFEKKYNEALERAKELLLGNEHSNTIRSYFEHIFPELRESKDEKIRKALIQEFKEKVQKSFEWKDGIPNNAVLAYLEKQKEQKLNENMIPCDGKCSECPCFNAGIKYEQKEQKPWKVGENAYFTPDKETPFKTKLAAYLQNNSPKDGQYVISSESILEMAKEELIKRGELQKPVEWSEEDERILKRLIRDYEEAIKCSGNVWGERFQENLTWLKFLRTQRKPSDKDELIKLKYAGTSTKLD